MSDENTTTTTTTETTDPEYVTDILTDVQTYLTHTGETVENAFVLLLINSVVDMYKTQRHYPDDATDATIDADVELYFTKKRRWIASQIVPALLGRVGGEGISLLIDNQVTKDWKGAWPIYLPDVVPYCGVV